MTTRTQCRRATRFGHVAASAVAALLLAACASSPDPPRPEPQTSVRLGDPGAGSQAPATTGATEASGTSGTSGTTELPALMVEADPADQPRPRISLDAVDQDLAVVLRTIARSYRLTPRIDRQVTGRVTMRLHEVPLDEALDRLAGSHGYEYSVQDGILRVAPATFPSRIFTLDYVSFSRVGTSTTVVQRRLDGGSRTGGSGGFQGTGGTGGAAGGRVGGQAGNQGQGADAISSVTVSDLWREIRIAFEAIVFTSAEEGGGQAGNTFQGSGGAEPFSRTGEDGRRLVVNPVSGTILVTGPEEVIEDAEAYLDAFEGSLHRQVLVEAKIVEVTLDRESQYGIDWSNLSQIGHATLGMRRAPGNDVEFTLSAEADVTAVLQALETQGEVRVLSSPRISVLNNQPAIFNVTTDEVFFAVNRNPILGPDGGTIGFDTQVEPRQISVGIVLNVLAQISSSNTVTMNVRPLVTDVIRVESITLPNGTQASAPVVDRRESDTVARLRSGETIVIGGLMQTRQRTVNSGVPGLMHIPGLGRLFRSTQEVEEKRELVIFVTTTIVAGQPQTE